MTILSSSSATASPITKALRILVLDANPATAKVLQWAIESSGDEVLICPDGDSAIESAKTFTPDVALIDLATVGTGAVQLCDRLRSLEGLAGMKIIAQAGRGREAHGSGPTAGFDLQLTTPVDLIVLADMLSLLKASSTKSSRHPV